MIIDPDYDIVGARDLPDCKVSLLLQKGTDFKTAIIDRIDLDEMISKGVLLDVEGDPFNTAFIKVTEASL